MYSPLIYHIFYSWNLYIIWLMHTMHPLNRKRHRRKLWRQVLTIQWLNQRNCGRMTSLRSVRQATATFCPAKDLLLVQGPFHFLRFILVQYTRIFFLHWKGNPVLARKAKREKKRAKAPQQQDWRCKKRQRWPRWQCTQELADSRSSTEQGREPCEILADRSSRK